MLEFISWKQYWIFILVIVVIYYLFVILRYYRKEVINVIRREPTEQDDSLSNDELLLQELEKLRNAASKRNIHSEELFLHIKKAVQQYPPDDEVVINSFINEHFPDLDEKYIRRIWQ